MADLKRRLEPLEGMQMPERWDEIQHRAPRAGYDPEPPRRHPFAVIAVAIALSVVSIGWLVSGFGSGDERVADDPAWVTSSWPSVGIEIDHPSTWPAIEVDEPIGHVRLLGGALTSTPMELRHPESRDTVTTAWDFGEVPDETVVFSATRIIGGPCCTQDTSGSSPLPDGLEDFREVPVMGGADGRRFVANAKREGVWVGFEFWFGPSTTEQDRSTVEQILASLRPTPLDDEDGSSPKPAPTLDPDAVDLGLGFGLCDAESLRGRFVDGGERIWFGTRTDEETGSCREGSRRHVLALDVDDDGVAESWINPIGPYSCYNDCGLHAVSDVDGDGDHEIVLLVEGGAIANFEVVEVVDDARLAPVTFEAGGEPIGWPTGGIGRLVIGGDEGYGYALTCEQTSSGPVLTQDTRSSVIDREELGTTVRTTTFRLVDDRFVLLSDETTEGVQDPPPLPNDSRLCDVNLGYAGIE